MVEAQGWRMNSFRYKIWTLICCMLPVCLTLSLSQSAFAQLRVGAARVDITPPAGEGGFDKPTGKYEHEHLYVRAIVIDNGQTRATIVGADQANMPDAVYK